MQGLGDNQNHNLSLVIAKNGVAGQYRWKTPCGGLKIVDAKVKVIYPYFFSSLN